MKAEAHRRDEKLDTCSTDDGMYNEEGEYDFHPSKLPACHGGCVKKYIGFCQEGELDTLIVDNTNCSIAEIAPYMAIAQAYEHEVEVLVWNPDKWEEYSERNTHGTPKKTIYYMSQHLKQMLSEWKPWWPSWEFI
jgi:hypothetical protein